MSEQEKKPATGVVREVAASDFKNGWYDYLDLVHQGHEEIVLTRYGKPIAKLVPFDGEADQPKLFGYLKGMVTIVGDIVGPTGEEWEANA